MLKNNMSTAQKVKGEGVNQIESKNYMNMYPHDEKAHDRGNTKVSDPFVETNN